jgi:beta-lactamase class A
MDVTRVAWVSLLLALCACAPHGPGAAASTPSAAWAVDTPRAAPVTSASRTDVETPQAAPAPTASSLDDVFSTLQPDPSADFGLIVEDVASGQRAGLNEGRVFRSGSVYKLPLAWHVLREVDRGDLGLDQPLEILGEDSVEPEPDGGFGESDTPTVAEALRAMFSVSSNAAAHALLRTVGRQELNQALDGAGLSQTRVPEPADSGEAMTSAEDIARLMRLIAGGQGLSPAMQAELKGLLGLGGPPDALRETLTDDVLVLDKTGNLEDASNVAALLITPRGAVILVALDAGVDPGDARAIVAQLARAAYTRFLE